MSDHHRDGFNSGNDALDSYFKKQANQDVRWGISCVYVMPDEATPKEVLGFYMLSTSVIDLTDLLADLSRKLPRHPVPAALLGRFAVHEQSQGSGLGALLLADAIKFTLAVAD